MSKSLESPIVDITEAYAVAASITRDLNVAEDAEDAIDARLGCKSSAQQSLVRLEIYVQDLLTGDHGLAKYASQAELVLPELFARLQRRYRKLA